ncbi:MAG: hydroxymethylpyrimidine/phosphomethylpyrimidine kinase [Bifidobacteriaceae bacterium]|nr:hydroxymethylpyrimidine/phosphomethylpyrimidine kinase [Bifidobacteriaceae bacterium]
MHFAYVIAGSEATGGAGIQVDLKTFQQLGVYGMGTITCVVSFDPKNNWGHRFVPVPPEVIADQFEAANASQDLDTVKIGMLGTPDTIDTVAAALISKDWKHVVLDPVLICKGQEPGAALNTDNALRQKILPLATVVTPNNFEAQALSGVGPLLTVDDLIEAGRRILEYGPRAAVVKGGLDFPGPDAVDVLVQRSPGGGEPAVEVLAVPKIGEERVSGAGCTFAAAITAELAKGASVPDAVRTAKAFVTRGIEHRVAGHTPFDTVWQGA